MNNYGVGNYHKEIINPTETLAGSSQLVTYAIDQLLGFIKDDRIITSCKVDIEYINTENTNHAMSQTFPLEKDLITIERSVMSIPETQSNPNYEDNSNRIREKIDKYLGIISNRGLLTDLECSRFRAAFTGLYDKLTSNTDNGEIYTIGKINTFLKHLHMPYELVEHRGTWQSPESTYELIDASDSIKPSDAAEDIAKSDNSSIFSDPANRSKLEQFMKSWFDQNGGKIYDKDRDEFYHEFTVLYQSIVGNTGSSQSTKHEDGVLTAVRSRSKQVIAMQELLNYGDINKILESAGLKYFIKYQQEPTEQKPGELQPRRYRHSLSLLPTAGD